MWVWLSLLLRAPVFETMNDGDVAAGFCFLGHGQPPSEHSVSGSLPGDVSTMFVGRLLSMEEAPLTEVMVEMCRQR
jgi:hypothetical protein